MLKYLVIFAVSALGFYYLSEWVDEATKLPPCHVVARTATGVFCSDGRFQ